MTNSFIIDLAVFYTDDDIDFVKEQRKFWARREQEVSDKTQRKECQKYVKATTIVIDYLLGTKKIQFPLELESYIKAIFTFATNKPSTPFLDIVKRGEEELQLRIKERLCNASN